MLRYHNITKDDMLNGDGLRVVLWTAGCLHHCKECQNRSTWDPNGGIPFDKAAKMELFEQLEKDYISGITLSGGDPLYEGHRSEITDLAREIKVQFASKTIWCYTGYLYEEVIDWEISNYIDVLVDGRFDVSLLDSKLEWCGSANQRVIPLRKMKEATMLIETSPKWTPSNLNEDTAEYAMWMKHHKTEFWMKIQDYVDTINVLTNEMQRTSTNPHVKSTDIYHKAKLNKRIVCERITCR